MRLVFCGSGEFALASLRHILESGHDVAAVVTQPPRPAGRGGKLTPTVVAELAQEQGLKLVATPNINCDESYTMFTQIAPDAICVIDFGQLIRQRICRTARLDTFNLHGSLLPELRGAAPVNWAIIQGHRQTGVTTFSLVDKMDAGPIYLQESTQIQPQETAQDLKVRLADIGAQLVGRTLDLLASGQARPQPQDESRVSLAPRLSKADGIINWNIPAEQVRNCIHGTWPWPGAQAHFVGQSGQPLPVTIARAEVVDEQAQDRPGVLDAQLNVATGRGKLRILQLKPAGKRLMDWRDFVNGHRLRAGDRFVQPQ